MKKVLLAICFSALCFAVSAGERISIPPLKQEFPRMIDGEATRREILSLLLTEAGKRAMQGIVDRVEPYAQRHVSDPDWLVGRLQMYWDSHATEVYIKGEEFDHAEGRAPVPTVRYTAARSTASQYSRPRLEDVKPFQDSLGLWMVNRATGEAEWADPRKTGRQIESINNEILGLARDAAFLWWLNGDERYARMAEDVFDTYVTGLYYRNVPVDLNHGHQQTLVGLTSFEVIHENAVDPVTECYDFLHDRLAAVRPDKMKLYETAFRKWADNITDNGVPHNNWNLFQAHFIFRLAAVLSDDGAFDDGRGRQFYLDRLLNESSVRQWSPAKLIEYGFDAATGTWEESPGYASNVVGDFAEFAAMLDDVIGVDLVAAHPVLALAVRNIPQYFFPGSHLYAGWGDTHYGRMRTDFYPRMIANARRHGKREQEEFFTAMYKCIDTAVATGAAGGDVRSIAPRVSSFTSMRPLTLDETVPAGKIEDYVSPTFYSEGVSWFAGRTGMDSDRSLMMSVCGSEGNHMHAGGISLELFGRGYVVAPDPGVGAGYTSLDYAEWYSQFPAHNTVCVDGISSYPVMRSHHAFTLEGCYPRPEVRDGYYEGVVFGDFAFLEPETQSDQRRTVAIINTDLERAYYVDVFRSRRRDGEDMTHDYFYHNIGQEFTLDVATSPTEELAFAGGHLYAYSYMWNKEAALTDDDITGRFTMREKDGREVTTAMWMKGRPQRRVFKALSPPLEGMSRVAMPYDVKSSPTQTYVARQYGEAWTRPFTAVFEPYTTADPSSIARVEYPVCEVEAVKVIKRDGRVDYIFSSDTMRPARCEHIESRAVFAVVSGDQLFMSRGTALSDGRVAIDSKTPATVAVWRRGGEWWYTSDAPCTVTINGKKHKLPASEARVVEK